MTSTHSPPEGVRFLIRSRLLTEDEMAHFGLS